MAILSRVKISPQQRFDLEDFFAQQSAQRTDSKLWTQKFLSSQNLVLAGFSISGIGLNSAVVAMTNAALILPQNTSDFSYFISSATEPDITIPDAQLVDGARNFIEAVLSTQDGTPLTKAFWDPEANNGEGAEFNQIVDTITDLKLSIVVSTGGFSGDPDRVPLAIIDVNGSGVIKMILDRRELYGRLAKPNDLDNEYAWGTKTEPPYTMVMTGVSGTFIAGETITIGSETATVVAGGTTTISFNRPSGISFANGSAVAGLTSGASGTVNTVLESFGGVDKSLQGQKNINDALMTEIKRMKGTPEWYSNAYNSNNGLSNQLNSVIVQAVPGANWMWDGTALSISDDDISPSASDVLANVRMLGDTRVINMQRQDGQDSTAKIPIGDEQVVFIKLPTSGTRNYSDVGTGDTNYQVVDASSYVPSDDNYWFAYRHGSLLYVRHQGELKVGEDSDIGDNVPQSLLDNLGLVDEVTAPSYSSNIRGTIAESLVSRIGVLTDAIGDEQEDRSAYLRSDDQITWTGTQLQFTSDIIFEILNTKTGTLSQHTVLVANSPFNINDGESIYVIIDRTQTSENVSPVRSSIVPIPAQTQANKDVIVLFRRVDVSTSAYLHIPFMKSLMGPGQAIRLGQSGSGSGITKVRLKDSVTSALPSGASFSVDGVSVANGDEILFTGLMSGNNIIYRAAGVGSSITWTAVPAFGGLSTATAGDMVIVAAGAGFANQIGRYTGTAWQFNDTVRYFDEASVNFWEQSSLKTSTLADNTTTNVFSVTAVGSENMVVDYSLVRNGAKETGTIWLTYDGSAVHMTQGGVYSALLGVTFTADLNSGNIRLRGTLTSTGFAATIKYTVKRWSDSPGGPSAVISYTPFVATINNAAFCMSDASGTPVNCSAPTVVSLKTRVTLDFSYIVGANAGTTVGDLDVYVNGQRFPRFISGAGMDGYYTEISSTVIEFYTDLSGAPLSIEVIKKV